MATFHKVVVSSHKATLAAKNEASYCWWDSYWSFNVRSNDSSRWFNVSSELEGGISPIDPFGRNSTIVSLTVWRSVGFFVRFHIQRQRKGFVSFQMNLFITSPKRIRCPFQVHPHTLYTHRGGLHGGQL